MLSVNFSDVSSLATCFWFGFAFWEAFSLSGDGGGVHTGRPGPPLDGLVPAPISAINVSAAVLEFLLATFPQEKSPVNVVPYPSHQQGAQGHTNITNIQILT